jgi:phage gp36-like protein
MPYASEDDLRRVAGSDTRWVQLSDNDGDGVPDPARVAAAQRAGDSLIDRILAPRFKTPIANPSSWLVDMAAEEGIYHLASSRGMATENDHDAARLRREDLAEMREGKQFPSDPLPAATSGHKAEMVPNDEPVSRSRMKGYI